MITLQRVKDEISRDPKHWRVYLMSFVDDLRYYRDTRAIIEPIELTDERTDALLASTVEYLCDEMGLEHPAWLKRVPACSVPYFVSGFESLKAFSIVESPLRFRMRKIFVLENFLFRV